MRARSEACTRLRDAIVDGRFQEDSAPWRDHVDDCPECRRIVEGLFRVRSLLARTAAEDDGVPMVPRDPREVVAEAFRRVRRERTRRRVGVAAVLLLGLGVGVWGLASRGPTAPADPLGRAIALHKSAYGDDGRLDAERVQGDADLRAELERGLDDSSALVRRVALSALLLGGVEVDPGRLEWTLRHWDEDLARPVELASRLESTRFLADALERGRVETLLAALEASAAQASRKGMVVAASAVVPHLRDADEFVRRAALWALSWDPSFVPGEEVWRLLREDSQVTVRAAAVDCVFRRQEDEGARQVVERLWAPGDFALEEQTATALAAYPEGLALSRERLTRADTPVRVALVHALVLHRAGVTERPEDWIARALADRDAETHVVLAGVAREADWSECRDALQDCWRVAKDALAGRNLALHLVAWDLEVGGESRLLQAVEVCEGTRWPPLRGQVEALARCGIAAVEARARALLEEPRDR